MRVEVNNGSARRGCGSLGWIVGSQRVSRIVGRNGTSPGVELGRMGWWVLRNGTRLQMSFATGKDHHVQAEQSSR